MKGEVAMPSTSKDREEKSTVSFNFPSKAKVQPEGFAGLSIEEEATIIIKGKIRSLEGPGHMDWENRRSLGIDMTSCVITVSKEQTSLDEAVKSAKETNKKVK